MYECLKICINNSVRNYLYAVSRSLIFLEQMGIAGNKGLAIPWPHMW